MIPTRFPSRLVLALLASLIPLSAQSPLFTDGPAFGGSKVFSEGRNPMGNPARCDQAAPGWYFTYLDGDQRAKDNRSLLQDSANGVPDALNKLQDAPWAQRTKAYGVVGVRDATQFGFTREEFNSMTAFPDLEPSRSGSAGNGTWVLGRRASVDRISFGGGSSQGATAFGASLRLERWRNGLQTAALNPGLVGGSELSMTDLDHSLLATTATTQKTLTYAMDMGFTAELAQGLRLGITLDQLNPKHLWDVYMQPQFRAGLQFDLGPAAKLAVESDVNPAARMPFPEKQQSSSASLRFAASPAVVFIVGAEHRKIGEVSTTRGGVTLQLRTEALLVGLGFQFGQDRPLRGATLMVN